jgi:hypothetical protein
MFTAIPAADIGHASAIYNTARQASVAIIVAILSAIVASVAGPRVVAFHGAYLALVAIAALGGLAAILLVRTRDAAATMMVGR